MPTSALSATRSYAARWAGSGPARTTPPWSPFFSLLQKNVLNRQRWTSREQLRLTIVIWIEKTYHRRRRRQGALGRMTPIEFETLTQTAHAA